MDASMGWFLLYIVVHVGFVVWAVTNRHTWWAIGIFLFPVVGDLAYLIYYFSTRNPDAPPDGVRAGETVIARSKLWHTGIVAMKAGDRAEVISVEGPPRNITIRTKNGRQFSGFRTPAFYVDKSIPGHAPQPPAHQTTSPAEAHTPSPEHESLRRELEELSQLQQDGLITEDEFAALKKRLLGL